MTSLRRALLAPIVAGVGVTILLALSGAYLFATLRLGEQFDRSLVERARTFASLVIDEPPDPGEGEPGGVVFDYDGPMDGEALGLLARISRPNGDIRAASPDWPTELRLRRPESLASPAAPVGVRVDDERWRAVALLVRARVEPPDETPAREVDQDEDGAEAVAYSDERALVEIVMDADPLRAARFAVAAALGLGGLLAVVGTALATWWGVGRGLAPVRELSTSVDRVGDTDQSVALADGEYPEELAPVAQAVDRLIDRLSQAVERERRFTDAAAHELRTPIAELRMLTEVAQRWPEPERLRRSIGEARLVAEEMESLLEALLAIARGFDTAQCEAERVPLLPVVQTVAGFYEDSDRTLVIDGDPRAAWHGQRGAVLAIVRNLLANAVDHSSPGSKVEVELRRVGDSAIFAVRNQAATLSRDDLSLLFEPFWRKEASRSDRCHRGLGLAIVQALCAPMGLNPRATLEGGVLTVQVGPGGIARGQGTATLGEVG